MNEIVRGLTLALVVILLVGGSLGYWHTQQVEASSAYDLKVQVASLQRQLVSTDQDLAEIRAEQATELNEIRALLVSAALQRGIAPSALRTQIELVCQVSAC